ncbi:MAG: hypothetical protein Q4E75_04990 [bacterium]|nr:hypothetical protein [bacterium]
MNILLNNIKKIILSFIISFSFINCFALAYNGCEYNKVSRLKSVVQNISISYDYRIVNNDVVFDVTISNLTKDIYLYDSYFNKNYYGVDGEITIENYDINKNSYSFYSNLEDCYGTFLGKKYVVFPSYNKYYEDDLCKGIEDFGLCKKWTKVSYSYEEFVKLVSEYKNTPKKEEYVQEVYEKNFWDEVALIYAKYYYYFLVPVILVCGIIVIVSKRKNKFKI